MVELASKKFVCIVDESKLVEGLGGSKGERPLAAFFDADKEGCPVPVSRC